MPTKIIRWDETDEAQLTELTDFHVRFKGIEVYYETNNAEQFMKDWRLMSDFMEKEVKSLEKPKSEARRLIDLFLARTKHIPKDKSGYNNWKQNEGIYNKGGE